MLVKVAGLLVWETKQCSPAVLYSDIPGVFVTGKLMKGGSVGVLAVVEGSE